MTVDELNKELEKLQKEGYGKLNIAYCQPKYILNG